MLYRHPVTIQIQADRDDLSATDGQWEDWAKDFAKIEPVSMADRAQAGEMSQGDITHSVTIRWQPRYAEARNAIGSMRILTHGQTAPLQVKNALNLRERNLTLQLQCVEVQGALSPG